MHQPKLTPVYNFFFFHYKYNCGNDQNAVRLSNSSATIDVDRMFKIVTCS